MKATDFLFGEVRCTENGEEKTIGLAARYEDFQVITHKEPEWLALNVVNKGNDIRKIVVRDQDAGLSLAPITQEEMDIDALFDENNKLCGCIIKLQAYSVFFKEEDDTYKIMVKAGDKTIFNWETITKDDDGCLWSC